MEAQLLKQGAKVQGTNYAYTIESVLGKGAYGVTYLAKTRISLDGDLGTIDAEANVTLKEFYMSERMSRKGDTVRRDLDDTEIDSFARCFYMEADTIASLSHPNIVKVLEVFVANNTCYYAMEYLPGGSMSHYIEAQNGLCEAEAIRYIRQIGSALSYMHQNCMVHLDVKPLNMMLDRDGTVKLIDYGLSHRYGSDGELELADGLGSGTPGYAPIEQSDKRSATRFAPTLDIYALAASYYKMLTGKKPNIAHDILNHGLYTLPLVSKHVSQQSIDAIKTAMQPKPEDRPQTVEAFLAMLPDTGEDGSHSNTPAKKKFPVWLTAILAVIAACVCIAVVFLITEG